jgi:hypothetical protein
MKLVARWAFIQLPAAAAGLVFMLYGNSPAWGRLGEGVASIENDRQQLSGQIQAYAETGYNINEITTPDGMKVREYAAPDGTVFAVTWHGSRMPDLSNLLGNYYTEYRDAASHGPFYLHRSSVRTAHMVVETGGPMRALWGRAIIPSLVPQGVSEDAIR